MTVQVLALRRAPHLDWGTAGAVTTRQSFSDRPTLHDDLRSALYHCYHMFILLSTPHGSTSHYSLRLALCRALHLDWGDRRSIVSRFYKVFDFFVISYSLVIHEVALSSQSYANVKQATGTNKRICNKAPRAECAYIINGTAPRAYCLQKRASSANSVYKTKGTKCQDVQTKRQNINCLGHMVLRTTLNCSSRLLNGRLVNNLHI